MSEVNENSGTLGMSSDQLQSAVQSIMSDPGFGKILAQVQGKGESGEEAPLTPPIITPEMMAKLPQMMQMLSPMLSGMKSGKSSDANSSGGGRPQSGGRDGGEAERRKRLLSALKPYLSDTRRDTVESILKVTEMTEMLSGLRRPDGDSK